MTDFRISQEPVEAVYSNTPTQNFRVSQVPVEVVYTAGHSDSRIEDTITIGYATGIVSFEIF